MATKNKKTVTKAFNKTVETIKSTAARATNFASTSSEKAVQTVKTTATKANDFALKSTEKVVIETLNVAGQWQGVTAKAVKGGLKLAATQQDIMFDTLEAAKGHAVKGFKRSKALLTK